ncbi:38522_t:CDS:2 [Gigaspora margarita]|uniref:38522_t:CDS:1 n=1 Tax=Gigaspora margarita TaxID=4874 RepID=A0ABN7VDZ0_GIGMA|nr:38522_t:CDS:2 [Gigaspora margarita]
MNKFNEVDIYLQDKDNAEKLFWMEGNKVGDAGGAHNAALCYKSGGDEVEIDLEKANYYSELAEELNQINQTNYD